MKRSRMTFAGGALLVLMVAPWSAARSEAAINVPISQKLPDTRTFAGQLAIQSFQVVGEKLMLVGTLSGQIADTAGNLLGTAVTQVTTGVQPRTDGPIVSVTSAAGTAQPTPSQTCNVLHLDIQPLHLELLGLIVDLQVVVLDIVAQSGPGNLLGNLLCQITGILDQGGPVQELSSQLNQVVRRLS